MKTTSDIKIYEFARRAHSDVNHLYDGIFYGYHLSEVADIALKFKHLIPREDFNIVLSSCYCHDLLEDTRLTYNDLKHHLIDILREDGGLVYHITEHVNMIVEIVYALTNEKGRNRKERANEKYYEGIRNTKYAIFVKLCDRIANKKYSKEKGSRMFEMYQKEEENFIKMLGEHSYKEMVDYMKSL